MNPKNYLLYAGWILLVVGILGFLVPDFLGETLSFDPGENWAHALLGLVALILAYWSKDSNTQKWVTVVFGLLALVLGLWGFVNPLFYGVNFQALDNVIHVVLGVWGLWAGLKGSV